jgi:hypothetical protein
MFQQETALNPQLARRSRCLKALMIEILCARENENSLQVHYTGNGGKLKDGQVFDSGDISFHFGQAK